MPPRPLVHSSCMLPRPLVHELPASGGGFHPLQLTPHPQVMMASCVMAPCKLCLLHFAASHPVTAPQPICINATLLFLFSYPDVCNLNLPRSPSTETNATA
eukprot:scaffold107898_cov24-Tisochrysis_lutea.AAC.1